MKIVNENNLFGLKDSNDNIIIESKYREIKFLSKMNIYLCKNETDYDSFDSNGKFLKTLNYNFITDDYPENNEFLLISKNIESLEFNDNFIQEIQGKIGIINKDFDVILEPIYDLIIMYFNQFYLFKGENLIRDYTLKTDWLIFDAFYGIKGGKWGVADIKGNIIIPIEYDLINPTFEKGIYLANKGGILTYFEGHQDRMGVYSAENGKWGIINSKNQIIKDFKFDEYSLFNEKVILKMYNKSKNLINASTKTETYFFNK